MTRNRWRVVLRVRPTTHVDGTISYSGQLIAGRGPSVTVMAEARMRNSPGLAGQDGLRLAERKGWAVVEDLDDTGPTGVAA